MNHHWIELAYSLALLGVGYLLATMIRRGLTDRPTAGRPETAPAGIAPATVSKTVPAALSKPETGLGAPADAAPASPTPQPEVEIPEVPIPGSELRYYKPFGPRDSIFDVWIKLQTFTSTEPIVVRLARADDTSPLLKSDFTPDGTIRSNREAFLQELTNSLRHPGPSAARAVRTLSSFGIPERSPEGSYHFFTGILKIELKAVRIMGLDFTVKATFEPNLGLLAGHFSHCNEYLHCEMSLGDASDKGSGTPETVVVGFPWTLTGITLQSEDGRLIEDGSKIARSIVGKYSKYVKKDQVPVTAREDSDSKVSVASDEIVAIAIHEGATVTKTGSRRFLRIDYGPFPQGPLDETSAGDREFVRFATGMAEDRKDTVAKDFVEEAESTLNTPF